MVEQVDDGCVDFFNKIGLKNLIKLVSLVECGKGGVDYWRVEPGLLDVVDCLTNRQVLDQHAASGIVRHKDDVLFCSFDGVFSDDLRQELLDEGDFLLGA